jgi:TonB family protein
MKILLLKYLLEASVCLAVFYTFYYLILRKERFFAYNRIFILLALLLSLLIPVMEIPLSQQASYLSQQAAIDRYIVYTPLEAVGKPAEPVVSQGSEVSSVGLWDFVLYGYGIVAFLFLIRFFHQVKRLYSLTKGGKKKEGYILIPTAGKSPTFSFFHWIFWDNTQQLSTAEENLILQHELAHIRQKHSWDTLLLEVLKVVFWFHPVIYLFKNALQEVHEYLADQAVVQNTGSSVYFELLVKQQLNISGFSFTHSFNQSQIYKRIAMIQSTQKSAKSALWKLAFALPVLAALLFMYSCKTSEITEPKPDSLANVKGVYRLGEVLIVGCGASNPTVRQIQLQELITGYGTTEKKQVTETFDKADIQPVPVNGMSSFQHYIRKNLQLPAQGQKAAKQGKVWLQFIVDIDGSISNITVVSSLGAGYDQEAIRLVKDGPAWIPGMKNGLPVAVRKVMPVNFESIFPESLYTHIELISDKPAENQPAPVDGIEAFYKKISRTVTYPFPARDKLIEGQVWVQFTVNTNGILTDLEVVQSVHTALDQEAIRVVSEAGLLWKPAIIDGQAQAMKLLFPVSFKLGA